MIRKNYRNRLGEAKAAPLRRSDKPLSAHRGHVEDAATALLKVKALQEKIAQQIKALQAMMVHWSQKAGALAPQLATELRNYENGQIRLKHVIATVEDIEPHIARTPSYTEAFEKLVAQAAAVSDEMAAEAQAIIKASYHPTGGEQGRVSIEVPGVQKWTFPGTGKLTGRDRTPKGEPSESVSLGEAWALWTKMLELWKRMSMKRDTALSALEQAAASLAAKVGV